MLPRNDRCSSDVTAAHRCATLCLMVNTYSNVNEMQDRVNKANCLKLQGKRYNIQKKMLVLCVNIYSDERFESKLWERWFLNFKYAYRHVVRALLGKVAVEFFAHENDQRNNEDRPWTSRTVCSAKRVYIYIMSRRAILLSERSSMPLNISACDYGDLNYLSDVQEICCIYYEGICG